MKKQISFNIGGHRADIGETSIYRLLPNQHTHHVGHFVFLDYVPPFERKIKMMPDTGFAHPHRGIATLTYILNGEAEHYDSYGNRAIVHSGGVQWMKAGNGIIHDETVNPDTKTNSLLVHAFQFWINLPSKNKKENPDYMAVQANELPLFDLDDNGGWLKVVVGEYNGSKSKVPTYAKQYLYHIHLNSGKKFTLPSGKDLEYAVFLPQRSVTINDKEYKAGDFIGFDTEEGLIEIINNSDAGADIILFGGEKYSEPFVAQGPFVMSTQEEINEAYADFQSGKYGKIVYN